MFPWLFNIYIDRVHGGAYKKKRRGKKSRWLTDIRESGFLIIFFTDDSALAAESAGQFRCLLTECGWLSEIMKLRANVKKTK